MTEIVLKPELIKGLQKVLVDYEGPLEAPILKGQEVGSLNIYYKDELLEELSATLKS